MATAISGVCPVLAVPFLADGRVDLDGFDAVVDHVLRVGVEGLTLFGLASEFHKLGDAERRVLRQRFLAAADEHDGVTAIVSVTAHATHLAVEQARAAVADGADALNILPPHFLGPSARDVTAHLDAVLDAVAVPVVVQYAPAQTGTSLDTETLAALARRHPNLRTVKVESQPPGRFIGQLGELEPPLSGLVGHAGVQMPDAIDRGAVGVQPGCSFTELYRDLWDLRARGQVEAFADLHRRMLPYLASWMQQVELIIQVEKTILHRRGLIGSEHCRAPGWTLDEQERTMIDRFLADFDDRLGA
jgi:dihydrodipicolinate synthase/N-acetylneuraminate lyase